MATPKTLTPPKNRTNPGVFGRAVIGESKAQRPTEAQLKADPSLAALHREDVPGGEYEKEQEWTKGSGQTFGDSVIGDSQPQKPTAAQLRQQPDLGPLHGVRLDEHGRVVPMNPEPAPVATAEVASSEPAAAPKTLKAPTEAAVKRHQQLPIAKIEPTLKEADYLFDSIVKAEFKRADGPRKAAVRLLLKHARQRQQADAQPGLWADVIARLEEALKPKAA